MVDVDIDVVFDQIVLAEESFTNEGFSTGLEEGCFSGYNDGFHAGVVYGAKLASEMGFYEGLALAWTHHLEKEQDKNRRKLKALSSLLEAVHRVTMYNPSDPHLNEISDVARMKYKQVCSLLNLASTNHQEKQSLLF